MKKIVYTLSCLLGLFLATSCSQDDMELNKGNDTLSLSASSSQVELDVRKAYAEAVQFTWTSGTNENTGAAIEYAFEIGVAGTQFSNSVKIDMGKGVYSMKYTHDEFVALLTDDLGLPYQQQATIEVRVTATVLNDAVEKQVSPVVALSATPYKPVSKTLYMIGDATPTGWNADAPTEMNVVSGVVGGFTWQGKLKANAEFKFITTKGQFSPSYNRDASTENALLFRDDDTQPDEKFSVSETANYRVTVNLVDLTINIEKLAGAIGPKYDQIYFVGSFTNWSFVAMRQDVIHNFLFRYGTHLTWNGGGEFKFGTASGSWDNMYHPTIASAPYTHKTAMNDDTNDTKWVLSESECDKDYKIVLDITEGEEKMIMTPFTPYASIYLVGSATTAGWDLANALPMSASASDANVMTWTGSLSAGELKFSCDKQGDWNGAWFMPTQADAVPTGNEEPMFFADKSNDDFKAPYGAVNVADVDMKWKIETAGNYTITLNQLQETISITLN